MTRQDKKEEVGYRLVAAKPMRRRIIGYRQLNFSEKQWPRAHLTTSKTQLWIRRKSAIDDVTLATCVMLHPTPNNKQLIIINTIHIEKKSACTNINILSGLKKEKVSVLNNDLQNILLIIINFNLFLFLFLFKD